MRHERLANALSSKQLRWFVLVVAVAAALVLIGHLLPFGDRIDDDLELGALAEVCAAALLVATAVVLIPRVGLAWSAGQMRDVRLVAPAQRWLHGTRRRARTLPVAELVVRRC